METRTDRSQDPERWRYSSSFEFEETGDRYRRDNVLSGHIERPIYELGERSMRVSDSLWGSTEIGEEPYDELLIRLARLPLLRRTQAIEQLTLGPEYATMPNTVLFSRWQHIWGSLVFVRKMTEDDPRFDPRQKMVMQLRTLLSDVGHTAFSHLGDWMFEGEGGNEDLHDHELKQLLEVTGVNDVLASHGFSVDEVVFPEVQDWIECKSPDLCVDRVDYGLREIMRWVSPNIPINYYKQAFANPKSLFEITGDGQLVIKDEKFAALFAAGYSILPTEHWAHPVHRLEEQLLLSAVESDIAERAEDDKTHPREMMYGIDMDFQHYFQTWEHLSPDIIMRSIASLQRQIFVQGRSSDLSFLFRSTQPEPNFVQFPEFPDPLVAYTWQSQFFGKPYPPQLDLEVVDSLPDSRFELSDRGLVVNLPHRKHRSIDPVSRLEDGSLVRLSQSPKYGPSYYRFLEGQYDILHRNYRATVLMRPDVAKIIVDNYHATRKTWERLITTMTRNPEVLAQVIKDSEGGAAGYRLEHIAEVY